MRISRQAQGRDKVRAHRARLRRRGLRPVQFWVPDVRAAGFPTEAQRQSGAVASPGSPARASDGTDVSPRRGEIWSVELGPYPSRTGHALVLQDDAFGGTPTVTICPVSDRAVDAPLLRPPIAYSAGNDRLVRAHLMIDRIGTISKTRLRERRGRVADEDLVRLNRAVLVFLGLAGRAMPEPA
jgi:mRNA interferase MazF